MTRYALAVELATLAACLRSGAQVPAETAAQLDKLATLLRQGFRQCSPDEQADRCHDADNDLDSDYLSDVDRLARDLAARVEAGEFESGEALREEVRQDCEGTQRVIYTREAKLAMVYSPNADAYVEEFGSAPMQGDAIDYSAMALMAMERDVCESMERLGVDLNNPSPAGESAGE